MPSPQSQPRLRKSLGQHHLRHPELCRPVLEFLRPCGRLVVEIGAGGGVLTNELVGCGARVIAWEVDPAWAFELRRRVDTLPVLIVAADALELPWERIPAPALAAGNLPYAVATPILERFLLYGKGVERGAFLVQREVADRLAARPGSRRYGLLSVMTAACAEVVVLARVRPGSFRPPPRVAGAFVGLVRRPPPVPEDELEDLRSTVAAAFAQRRKTVSNALASAWGRSSSGLVLREAGIEPSRRAESLSLRDFVALHRARCRHRLGTA